MPETLVMHNVPCPLCGGDEFTPVLRTPDWTGAVAGEFQIVRCSACSHLYTNPAPVDSSLPDCYPPNYGPHLVSGAPATSAKAPAAPPDDARSASGSASRRQPWYLSPVVRRIPGPRLLYRWVTDTRSVWIPPDPGAGRRALELGCSSGWFLAQLREHGWSPVGVDLVEGPLAQARAAGFQVHRGTLDTVKFDNASFDAVFAWMVLEHVPRPRETLREIHRVLQPGGHFAFSVPTVSCWEPYLFGRHWLGYELPRHLQHFSTRRLRTLLGDEGFAIERVIPQPSFFNWLGSLGSWLEQRFPRSALTRRVQHAYQHNPPLGWYFVLGPLAHLNALLRQSGRLTIVTRKRS